MHCSLKKASLLELAAKPCGEYSWNPRHEVVEDLAEG
jgi:hypothetical protein